MIAGLAALILLGTLSQTQEAPHPMPLTVADVGDNVTLICSVTEKELGLFYWFKLDFGFMVQPLAAGTFDKITINEQFDNSRFTVTKEGNLYLLVIRNVSKEDEATYFCQAGAAYTMKMINGTLLSVNDLNLQKSVYVKQTPKTASIESGDSMTLQCSLLSKNEENQCPGEQSVYWFRAGSSGFNPGVIYTNQKNNDEQEERSCVYSISKTVQGSSDDGMYYCAVVTCGEILFGEGTKVETRNESWALIIVLGLLLAFCIILIVTIILIRKQKPLSKSKGEPITFTQPELVRSDGHQPNYLNDNKETGPLNYVVLDFPSRKRERCKNKVELPEESLYSFMKESQ